jgi:hypothetical protein
VVAAALVAGAGGGVGVCWAQPVMTATNNPKALAKKNVFMGANISRPAGKCHGGIFRPETGRVMTVGRGPVMCFTASAPTGKMTAAGG